MMLTILGLPITFKYHDLKAMIKEKCSISDFILDNLLSEGDGTKKVRIGLRDEREGAHLIKCLDGIRIGSNLLRIAPVGKTPPSNMPSNFDNNQRYPPRNDYANQSSNYGNSVGRPEPVPNREPWAQGNQWSGGPGPGGSYGDQVPAPQQNSYNYQPGINTTTEHYGQQGQRSEPRTFDLRDQFSGRVAMQEPGYGFPPKNNIPDAQGQGPASRRAEPRSHVLRSVEIIDEPLNRPIVQGNRYPGPGYDAPHKSMTIMKDNFQGPQYNLDRQSNIPGQFHGSQPLGHADQRHLPNSGPGPVMGGPGAPAVWNQPIQSQKVPYAKTSPVGPGPFDRKYPDQDKRSVMAKPIPDSGRIHDQGYDKPGPRFSPRRDIPPTHGRMPSPGHRIPATTRPMSPGHRTASAGHRGSSHGRRGPSPGRRMPSPGPGRRMPSPGPGRRMPSPGPGRRMPSPGPGRRMPSPGRRMPSPGRRMPSPGRRMPSPGRRMPSPGRRMPSPGRRMPSPGRRMPSPGRRMPSPGKRVSPGRRMSPGDRRVASARSGGSRFSPPRHEKGGDKYQDGRPPIKDVRPAYDTAVQAFSAGYRPSLHENVQYPIPGLRQEPRPAWPEKGFKKDDDRREPRPKFEPREDKRKSRSPLRGDRERLKKHSPSPRSPRRSWALEKRRSPDMREAPPPPLWPANDEPFRRFDDDKPRQPVWEGRRPEDERRFEDNRRPRDPSPRRDDRFPPRDVKFDSRDHKYEPKFEPRDPKFEARGPKFEPRDPKFEARGPKFEPREPKFEPREPKFEPREPKFEPREPKFEPREEFRRPDRDFRDPPTDRYKGDFPREEFHREDDRKLPKIPDVNKEFEDVYKRALELNKRADELRRRDDRRRDDHSGRRDTDEKNLKHDPQTRREDRRDTRDDQKRPEWKTDNRHEAAAIQKAKREKATEEIVSKIMDKHGKHLTADIRKRVIEELKLAVGKILSDMFGYEEVSFIEMVVKFNSKIDARDELKMYNDVMESFPSHFRKRAHETATHEVPPKTSRLSSSGIRDAPRQELLNQQVPEWVANMPAPGVAIPNPLLMSQFDMVSQMALSMQQPLMVPAPNYMMPTFEEHRTQPEPHFEPNDFQETAQNQDEGYNLYLCKDDFDPYSETQAEYLKKFLVSQLISQQDWSPDFTIKGLQSVFRYEVVARDDTTRDWFLKMDFSGFGLFNVLVYTKEELWFERAAIWLPGHSRCRNIEPLVKLTLQNRRLDGVNVGKWKLVKKIVNPKGTRIYVDMPPSSARALEKHKMLLSYELQKVSVFLKAIAVDKEAFDMGLREMSVKDQAEIITAAQNCPMPSLGNDPNIVKICLKGNKALTLQQARKIKEMVIYHIFKYHQEYEHAPLKTDFVKYGFCLPGYFGLLPENPESRRWIMSLDIGKLNRHAVVVVDGDETQAKLIKMTVVFKHESSLNTALVFERLRQSNQGVKGLNFGRWKPVKIRRSHESSRSYFGIDMDIESVETLMKLNFKLDYVDDKHSLQTVYARYDHSDAKLEEIIHKLKAESKDSYDVANMDLASSEEEDDDLVFMGEFRS